MSHTSFKLSLASFVLVVAGIISLILLDMSVAILTGSVAYVVFNKISRISFMNRLGVRPSTLATAVVTLVPVLALTAAGFSAISFVSQVIATLSSIQGGIGEVVLTWTSALPSSISRLIPKDAGTIQLWITSTIESQKSVIASFGAKGAEGLVEAIIGLIIGLLIANSSDKSKDTPLTVNLRHYMTKYCEIFDKVITSQIWIASINTVLSALFLFIILPAFDVTLPYRWALVAITFIAGLLPIVGNLVCNVILTSVGLSQGIGVAAACLLYLMLIHKLEFLINAKVVGGKTNISTWEMLSAIFVSQAVFGISGLIMGPLIYAYVKGELREFGWV